MNMRKSERDKKGSSVLARCVVICIVAAFICSSGIAVPGLAAQQTGGTVTVTVNAPEEVKAGETFDAGIDVDSITDFNSGQFDLSFDSGVVSVTAVADGSIDGATIPVDRWEFMDKGRIRVILDVPGISAVSGSGYLAKISFEVVGKGGDRSVLDLSNGLLVDTEAEEIPAEWIDDEVIIGLIQVKVNAPEYVDGTFDASIDVDSITDFNSGQFDLSFDSSVVNVATVADGSIDGATIPVDRWEFMDKGRIRVILDVPGISAVSGSGYLAKISFEVVGKGGDRSVLDISNGLLVDTEAEEIKAEWYDDEVYIKRDEPSVTIETDKSVYKQGEKQIIALTIENPTSKPVQAKLGMGFHVFEIEGSPYSYDKELFETEMFWLPTDFKKSFVLQVEGLELPEGEYAWSAYLKDAKGVKIAESEAKFSIVAAESSISTVPSPGDAIFKDLSENVKRAVNAELS